VPLEDTRPPDLLSARSVVVGIILQMDYHAWLARRAITVTERPALFVVMEHLLQWLGRPHVSVVRQELIRVLALPSAPLLPQDTIFQ
jgi:hypothetical protein